MKFASVLLLASVTAWATGAGAQNFPGAPGAAVLNGKCLALIVAKLDASKGCNGEIASVTLPDGTVTFIFSAGGKLLGFQGDGRLVKPAAKGAASMPLQMVSSGAGGKITGQVQVSGACTFADPYSGKPATVECSAKSKDATFTARFQTNGKPPHKK